MNDCGVAADSGPRRASGREETRISALTCNHELHTATVSHTQARETCGGVSAAPRRTKAVHSFADAPFPCNVRMGALSDPANGNLEGLGFLKLGPARWVAISHVVA